ncbi:hypothetical protein D9758_001850 [Tetrapyrgos nigripes]|uniref:Uncharacterized protein n=1 Tax=Tetrapyrgos nigripes TaxID=182062 RepID=A0A8H5LVC1_9AGAR|nr:hypothetical protein D9758_001850 [Tetrapyrgos nigripes]
MSAGVVVIDVIFMANTQSQEKIDLLRMLGAEVYPVPAVAYDDPKNYNHQARDFAKDTPNSIWTDQFDNTVNANAHSDSFARQAQAQAGAGKFLHEKSQGKTQIWLADPLLAVFSQDLGYVTSGGKLIERTGSSITKGIGQGRITNNLETLVNQLSGAFTVLDEQLIEMLYRMLDIEGLYLSASFALNVAAAVELAGKLGKTC